MSDQRTEEEQGEFVAFWKKVGIVGSGVVVACTILGVVIAFTWRVATAPFVARMDAIEAASVARVERMMERINRLEENTVILGDAMQLPTGSRAQERALRPLQRSRNTMVRTRSTATRDGEE